MLHLNQSLTAWNTSDVGSVLKKELEACNLDQLPLEKGASKGGYVGNDSIAVTVNHFSKTNPALMGSVGIFFTEIEINCGCGDEPMSINAYCELRVSIDKTTAAAHIVII